MNTVKTSAGKRYAPPGMPISWRQVVAALQDSETRSSALMKFRAAGFKPDDFVSAKARAAMVEVLVWIEDTLESAHHARRPEAAPIKAVRRRLEVEVWP